MPFIHKSYGTLYDIIRCYQRYYDIIHTSNNGLAHSNCIVTCQIYKKQKIVLHRYTISRISDSTIFTSHSIRYEIIMEPKLFLLV